MSLKKARQSLRPLIQQNLIKQYEVMRTSYRLNNFFTFQMVSPPICVTKTLIALSGFMFIHTIESNPTIGDDEKHHRLSKMSNNNANVQSTQLCHTGFDRIMMLRYSLILRNFTEAHTMLWKISQRAHLRCNSASKKIRRFPNPT